MEKKIIITIGREFGSGGRQIGKQLADLLGIEYYDKELIYLASKESGLCTEFFEKADEKKSGSLLQAFALGFSMNNTGFISNDFLSNESLFKIQADVIRQLATQKSCIFVGRCADYILRDEKYCTNLFIHSNPEDRIKRIKERHQISEQEAGELMRKTDKSRASYYNYYTDKTWGVASSYDLTINSSILGLEKTVEFIKTFIER